MAGRPVKSKGGTRSPLLMALLGASGGGGDALSGVEFKDSIQPGALNKESTAQGVNYTKKAEPTHWWNTGKANRVNNEIALQGILGNQSGDIANKHALQFAQDKIPIGVQERNAIDPLDIAKAAAEGDNQLLNIKGLLSQNKDLYQKSTTVPQIENIIQGLNSGTQNNIDMDVSNAQKLATGDRAQEISEATRPAGLNTAINTAKGYERMSGLENSPNEVTSRFKEKNLVDAAKLNLLKSEAAKNLNPIVPIGGERVNLLDQTRIKGPEDALTQLIKAKEGVNGALPANIPNEQEGQLIVKDGKPGRIIRGQFVPLGAVTP